MNSMTRLAFLIVLILMVTPSIVFHKSHSVAAQESLVEFINPDEGSEGIFCIDPSIRDAFDQLRTKCALIVLDPLGDFEECSAIIIHPSASQSCDCPFSLCSSGNCQCWQCFGVNCQ